MLTWNDESLASHDEDDLHRTELNQSKLPSLIQSESKLCNKDCREPADADRFRNVRRTY